MGGKRVTMMADCGSPVIESFDVKDVSKSILSAGSVVAAGGGVCEAGEARGEGREDD